MAGYRIICVGKRAQDPALDSAEIYLKRIKRYAPLELLRLKETNSHKEGQQILAKVPHNSPLITLDEHGDALTSVAFASFLTTLQSSSTAPITFAIGAADGLHERVIKHAKKSLSLSPMTLPHRVALMLLAEQIYRAHTIINNERYHRE